MGFRPFVYGLAQHHNVLGSVQNNGGQVEIFAHAPQQQLQSFLNALQKQTPSLARIKAIHHHQTNRPQPPDFRIIASTNHNVSNIDLPPDIALCADCQEEMLAPQDRRYLYPFINCINCGPRLTIIDHVPYDRPNTSMAAFVMCPACQQEYNAPNNRRFHAQPIACPVCGPQLTWLEDTTQTTGPIALTLAAQALRQGKIIALRGMGGFQLAGDASFSTITRLRQRKKRPHKPLAVMAANLTVIRHYCQVSPWEEQWLTSPQRPILLLTRKTTPLPDNLAPGLPRLGVMLPTTPLHHLLLNHENCPDLLVMTSGNQGGEPICIANEEACQRLNNLAEGFLIHNREILTRVDDSVAEVRGKKIQLIRRARGFVPQALELPWPLPPLLACGPQLKNTITLAKNKLAWTSQHIGDLSNPGMMDFFLETISHLQQVLQIAPEQVVCDLHPDYQSSLFAHTLDLPLTQVQHHHAHAVAIMAEHGLTQPALAIVLDGAGLGDDGTIWGGEILRVTPQSYQRLGHLAHLPLPGGDVAAEQPWRMACAALYQAKGSEALNDNNIPPALRHIPSTDRATLVSMLTANFNTPATSSCGRLFDAVASLLDLRHHSTFEGQAAMELEVIARQENNHPLSLPSQLQDRHDLLVLDSHTMIRHLLHHQQQGKSKSQLALAFHHWLSKGLSEIVNRYSQGEPVILAGGCLQNHLLSQGLCQNLQQTKLKVYTAEKFPTNDGGLSLGQAIIGGLQNKK